MTATAETTTAETTTTAGLEAFHDTLRTLSQASVDQHFDAFTDIDWENPDFAVDQHDERWILPEVDVLGATEWYQALPREEQIRVGLYRQANIVKVGLQFEQILISGLMAYNFNLENGNPEFRYSTHEATEECHHTQMFQEFVNRSGMNPAGGSKRLHAIAPVAYFAAKSLPVAFFFGVLAGEEPIDHVQKTILRTQDDQHPLLRRIMQIHVAEEARHIGFAHQYLQHYTPQLSRRQRGLLSVTVPVIMRLLCDDILVPSKQAQRDMGIPDEVVKELWWDRPDAGKFLRDLFGDVRMLADDAGLMNRASRRVWRWMKIDGRPSRFRSEPASAAA